MTFKIDQISAQPQQNIDSSCALNVQMDFHFTQKLIFDFDVMLQIQSRSSGDAASSIDHHTFWLSHDGWQVSWLPHGKYRLHINMAKLGLQAGKYSARLVAHDKIAMQQRVLCDSHCEFNIEHDDNAKFLVPRWQLEALGDTPDIEQLSWRQGAENWFYKHFDHAARTTISYMLGDSELLRGKVLDVGCGDGITDLGIALRCQPEEFIGIDPFKGFARLPQVLAENHVPTDVIPACLKFLPADANALPFADNHFDVVISWGSLEHIAGGYMQALKEIQRVLKPGGLFFVHPGLFYSNIGHHLGEFPFAQEAYVHLKHSEENLKQMVLNSQPERIDRSGDSATSAQYWQWYTELNRMTVTQFEKELREMNFELSRVAVRSHERVDYTPAIAHYPIYDLATSEVYISAWNRKVG